MIAKYLSFSMWDRDARCPTVQDIVLCNQEWPLSQRVLVPCLLQETHQGGFITNH